jgi:hypothetical protein
LYFQELGTQKSEKPMYRTEIENDSISALIFRIGEKPAAPRADQPHSLSPLKLRKEMIAEFHS